MVTTIPFLAYEISGLAKAPNGIIYNSGAANNKFVIDVSGGLANRIAAGGGVQNAAFQNLTAAAAGGLYFDGSVKVSSASARQISVLGYSTISTQAQVANKHLSDSGSKYHKAYLSGTTGVFQLHNATLDAVAASNYTGDDAITTVGTIGTGTWQGTTVKYAYLDGTALPNISSQAQKARASSQLLKAHSFHAKISSSYLASNYGWTNITSGSKRVAHGLAGAPNFTHITPSGTVTFAYAVYNTNTTDFTVAITAAGSRTIRWQAQI
jgi:hypothetical protein